MKTLFAVCLIVCLSAGAESVGVSSSLAFAAAAPAASPFGNAKWIGSNAALTPEIDFSKAEWINWDGCEMHFDAAPDGRRGRPVVFVRGRRTE